MDGIRAAMTLSRRMGIRKRVLSTGEGYVDVFAIIEELDIPFSFVDLDLALGFCLPFPQVGIVVTTNASLHRQRYTAAHELGHAVMEHRGSIDTEILMRGGQSMTSGDLQEVAAEAFAAELLMPKWLLVHHMRRKGWTIAKHLVQPDIVYQLSLRVAASFEATCWSLFGNQLLPGHNTLNDLLRAGRSLSKVKRAALDPLDARPGHANVLRLHESDSGAHFPLSQSDYIRIDLKERIGSGFAWEYAAASASGFSIAYDGYNQADAMRIGAPGDRSIIFTPPSGAGKELLMSERRPWAGRIEPETVFGVTFDVLGPEKAGMSRARRRMLGLALS